MCLEGGQDGQRGYAMAALLVSIAVMMVLMSMAMPVWRTQAQREKEAELIFRGEQYARAVNLYTRKMGPGSFPPSIDVLVQQRFLRKKYKDPMTKDGEFEIITAASAAGQPGLGGRGGQQQPGNRGTLPVGPSMGLGAPPSANRPPGGGFNQSPSPFASNQGSPFGQAAGGGIMGVRSKSKESSFRAYNGATHYNEWNFLFANVSNRPGGMGAGRPGMPGRQGGPGGMMPGIGGFPGGGRGPGGRGEPQRGFGPGNGRGRR